MSARQKVQPQANRLARATVGTVASPNGNAANDALFPYAGSKLALRSQLHAHMPNREAVLSGKVRYFEPFAGSASFALALLAESAANYGGRMKATLNDSNGRIPELYRAVRDEPEALIRELRKAKYENSHEAFYEIKAEDRLPDAHKHSTARRAARFVYLVSHCNNGICRVNRNGDIGVSYQTRKRMRATPERIRTVSALLQNVDAIAGDFEAAVKSAKAGDVVFVDPPYIPQEGKGDGDFYSSGRVDMRLQDRLVKVLDDLTARGVHWMLSNSDCKRTRELYGRCKTVKINTVTTRRRLQKSGQTDTTEILAVNRPERLLAKTTATRLTPRRESNPAIAEARATVRDLVAQYKNETHRAALFANRTRNNNLEKAA